MDIDRRQDKRQATSIPVGIFLSEGRDGQAISPVSNGQLVSISRRGAGIALHEIMSDRIHLAFAAMESDTLLLNLTLQLGDREAITIPAKAIWFNKKNHKSAPPFRIGLEFLEPLSSRELKRLNKNFG